MDLHGRADRPIAFSGRSCRWLDQTATAGGGIVIIKGIVFAGTATPARDEMAAFVRDVLGLQPAHVAGVEADLFNLPDGSSFAVASPQGMGTTQRSLGFLVDDIDSAVRELAAAGVDVRTLKSRVTNASSMCISEPPTDTFTSSSSGCSTEPGPA